MLYPGHTNPIFYESLAALHSATFMLGLSKIAKESSGNGIAYIGVTIANPLISDHYVHVERPRDFTCITVNSVEPRFVRALTSPRQAITQAG